MIDDVRLLPQVQIAIKREANSYRLEAAIPLKEINFKPRSGLRTLGDFGRVLSDQTASTRIDRVYWSNKDTNMVSDVPSEARLQPSLWGTLIFE